VKVTNRTFGKKMFSLGWKLPPAPFGFMQICLEVFLKWQGINFNLENSGSNQIFLWHTQHNTSWWWVLSDLKISTLFPTTTWAVLNMNILYGIYFGNCAPCKFVYLVFSWIYWTVCIYFSKLNNFWCSCFDFSFWNKSSIVLVHKK